MMLLLFVVVMVMVIFVVEEGRKGVLVGVVLMMVLGLSVGCVGVIIYVK